MAGCAIAGICARMIKRRASKGRGVMAHVTVLTGGSRYVVRQFTDADHVIVAGVTTTHKRKAGMIKDAGTKGTRGMAGTAILNGWHVFV